jgi:hypothetical protein
MKYKTLRDIVTGEFIVIDTWGEDVNLAISYIPELFPKTSTLESIHKYYYKTPLDFTNIELININVLIEE